MTLWDFEKVMRHSLAITLSEIRRRVAGTEANTLTIEKMIRIRNEVADELRGRVTNLEEIRFHAFKRTLDSIGLGSDELAVELNALYLKHRFEDLELYPDVVPTLELLRRHYSLGLISNGNGYPDRCGLNRVFSFVTFSESVGAEKPDRRIFLAACEQACCEPEELIHVGDSVETDVIGANSVGATSIWLNRNGNRASSQIEAHLTIHSLAELLKVLMQNF